MIDLTRIAAVTNALTGESLKIDKVLVLSTVHLPSDIAEDMDNGFRTHSFVYDKVEDGYLVCVGNWNGPPEMAQAIALAQFNDCKWIRFDSVGPRLRSLPAWEW